jgi:hypothetical protein
MDLDDLLLLVAFRRRIREADSAAGQARVEAIVGREIDPATFTEAVRRLVTSDLIHDPVFLSAGALQAIGSWSRRLMGWPPCRPWSRDGR